MKHQPWLHQRQLYKNQAEQSSTAVGPNQFEAYGVPTQVAFQAAAPNLVLVKDEKQLAISRYISPHHVNPMKREAPEIIQPKIPSMNTIHTAALLKATNAWNP